MESAVDDPTMPGRAVPRRRLVWFIGAVVVVLAAWNNVAVTRLPDYPGSYVVANVAAAGLLLAAARWIGLTWDELGLARRRMPAGLKWGGVSFALVAAGYAILLAVPAFRPLLTDDRVEGLDAAGIAYHVLVHVPFGNVLWEEVAFRGVLLAAFTRVLSVRWATAASSVLFGIWHIRPTVSGLEANDVVNGPLLIVAVLVTCLATTVAGVVFTWLRLRSGSLLAPMLLHLATNSLGLLAAAAAFALR
jgi:membrane protease YdiL (CAAX protease family)